MNGRALACVLLLGCGGAPRMIRQTTVTQLREQQGLVMSPEAPVGFGASLPAGGGSLSVGAGFTSVRAVGDSAPGQHPLPLSGLVRGATAAGERFELTASGSVSSPDVDLGPVAPGVDGLSGVLARGAVGVRGFVPLKGLVEWGLSFDLGAEASHLGRTDTVVTEVRTRHDTGTTTSRSTGNDLRIHPHVRTGTVLRVPTPLGFTAVGGVQLQTWPVYWASRAQQDTCTRWSDGEESCVVDGSVSGRPSPVVGVFTPTLGLTVTTAEVDLHVQGFVNTGDVAVDSVPWGAMVMVEHAIGRE